MDKRIAATNFDYCQETISLKSELEISYLDLASRLHRIELNRMFEPNYDTFDDFLEDIKLTRSSASKMIAVWRTFIIKFKMKPKQIAQAGGVYKAYEVIKYSNTRKQAEEWLLRAKENTRRDLRKHLTEAKTGISMVECKHKDCEIITYRLCKKCGDTERIYDEDKPKT